MANVRNNEPICSVKAWLQRVHVREDVASTWCLCHVLLWFWTLFTGKYFLNYSFLNVCVLLLWEKKKCITELDSFIAVKSTLQFGV